MNKKHCATIVATLGALALAACGGEQGRTESTGASTLDLSTAAGTALPTSPNDARREWGGSCVLNDGLVDNIIMAGGFNLSGTPLSDSWTFKVGGSWTKLGTGLAVARGKGAMLKVDATHCVFVGGETAFGTTGSGAVDVLTVNTSTHAFSWAAGTALNVARGRLGVSICGSKLLAFGGVDGATRKNTIELSSNLVAGAAWSTQANTLARARYDFGLARDGSNDRYLIAGGNSATSSQENTVEVVTTSTCTPTSTLVTGIGKTLTSGREGLALFDKGSQVFMAVGGQGAGSTVPTNEEQITVNFTTPSSTTFSSTATAVTGAYYPMAIKTTTPNYLMMGGVDPANVLTTNGIQEYTTPAPWTKITISTGRVGGNAEQLGSVVYLFNGATKVVPTAAGNALISAVEVVTP